jgi:hypothetical protein
MSPGPADGLLAKLASSTRPQGVPDGGARAKTPIEGRSFKELLAQASTGEIASGIPVKVSASSGVKLTSEQLTRLQSAADAADAQGATKAVVLIDGVALGLDVQSRTIVSQLDLSKPGVHAGFDAVLSVPGTGSGTGSGAGTSASSTLPPPSAPVGGLEGLLATARRGQ